MKMRLNSLWHSRANLPLSFEYAAISGHPGTPFLPPGLILVLSNIDGCIEYEHPQRHNESKPKLDNSLMKSNTGTTYILSRPKLLLGRVSITSMLHYNIIFSLDTCFSFCPVAVIKTLTKTTLGKDSLFCSGFTDVAHHHEGVTAQVLVATSRIISTVKQRVKSVLLSSLPLF